MKTKTKVILVSVVVTVLAFLTNTVGPLGTFWRPAPEAPIPNNMQTVLLAFLLFIEASAFGLGAAFLFFGYPLVQGLSSASRAFNRVTHLSVSWLLLNWWAHDSLHIHTGMSNLNQLLVIDYVFHFTIIASTVILVAFLIVNLRNRRGVAVNV